VKVVLYLEKAVEHGGRERFAARHAAELRAAGHEVEILSSPDPAAFAAASAIVVHRCMDPAVLELFPPEKTEIWLHDHEAVCPRRHGYPPGRWTCRHAAGWWPCLFCAPLCRDWRGGVARVAGQRRRTECLRRMKRIVVLSRFLASRLAANGIPADRISVEPPEIRLGPPRPLPAGTGPVDLLYVGQLLRGKGVQVLLRALARLPEGRTLDVAGAGNHEGALRRLAARLGVDGRVRWRGVVEDAQSWMRAAACVVVPSVWPEPYGLVAAEAVALGRPVVASDVGGIPEACGGKAVLVPPGDVAALAEALARTERNRP
jgi:glycosyltransferase involved in cell wall biosynthesis